MEIVTIGDEGYIILGIVSVSTSYDTDQLKSMWRLADTILRSDDKLYVCQKIIKAEFKMIQCLTYIVIINYIKVMKKIDYPEYTEKGVRYMMCSSHYYMKCNCGEHVAVGDDVVSVRCSTDVMRSMFKMFPLEEKSYKPTGRPPGWHFMKEFVDKDGNVFHRGKEQPKLKGTLLSTKIKLRKKIKRRTKEQILIDRHNEKKAVLKKDKKKKTKVINERTETTYTARQRLF